jgi:hypothetical protein
MTAKCSGVSIASSMGKIIPIPSEEEEEKEEKGEEEE